MASDINSVPSRLGPGPDSDHLPLAALRSHLLRPPQAPRAEPSPPAPDRCEPNPAPEGTRGAAQQSWPGLPRGVEFNPSDSDLLWHLAAEIGNGLAHRHPFISEFIKSGDEDGGFGRTHPQDMPGMSQDGHASYFFHKKVNLYNNKSDKYISWQKSGASRSIILDGNLQGCKEVFVLYAFKNSDDSPQRTDWELHQYHIKNRMEDEGELVVSKIFYKSQNNHCELAEKAHVQPTQDDSVTGNGFKEEKEDTQLESHSVNMVTDSNYKGNVNNQEKILVHMYPDQYEQSSCKDVLVTADIDHENKIYNQTETDLDHMSLQERYRILLANRHSCSARVSAEACAVNDLDNSSLQKNAETSGPVPKSESEEINHEGTAYKEDICSMLQEISSAPSITDSMDADNNVRLLGEIPLDTQRYSVECFVKGKEVPCDPAEDAECPVNDKTLNSTAELLSSQTLPCGDENVDLAVRNSGTYLVDVKMEPALEDYAVYPSESPCVNSHHSNNDDLKDSGTVPECSETDFTHAEGSLPSLVVKSELTGYELPGLCENSLNNSMEPTVKRTHTRTPNCNEGLPYCSRQRKKRKNAMDSSEKVLEKDAYENDEGTAYPCRRRRKKKTATDSIETALEEDAPGLLQILLDKGIVLNEIKLYDVGEVDEMLPECTESDFQDLENVITKLFPQRASLLKVAARNVKGGGKAIYCLACLISLIEQSRYLQFRDCPVEWGWCRDLQSFIFVFRSHNRLVLERPEYGYATYFFEIVQSVPIEWQIRRLVTAMKLSSCGRTALIENRPLLIGEDLSEGEAKVLEEYGWIPNTGLGTMLNYRDRVVHDRWNEKYSTDWRMKIGRLLMNGYSEGHCIITHVPLDMLSEEEIKLEDPL